MSPNLLAENEITYKIIGCTYQVYQELGPGLLESIYEKAMILELKLMGLKVVSQKNIEVEYKGITISDDLRVDLIVEDSVIVELKSVENLLPIHHKQILTYMRLTNTKLGLLINFNVSSLKDGIFRKINDLKTL